MTTTVTPGRDELAEAICAELVRQRDCGAKLQIAIRDDLESLVLHGDVELLDLASAILAHLAAKPSEGVREATIRECANIARACEDGRDAADAIAALHHGRAKAMSKDSLASETKSLNALCKAHADACRTGDKELARVIASRIARRCKQDERAARQEGKPKP